MPSKQEITDTIRAQFANVRERGRVLAQALKARADIAATRRRLRLAFADLGEDVYRRIDDGTAGPWAGDQELADHCTRIKGVEAELRQRERSLAAIMNPPADVSTEAEEGQDAAASSEA